MRIGIDYTVALKQAGGIGRITRGLIEAIAALDHENQYLLLAARDAPPLPALGNNFTSRRMPFSERSLNILWHRLHLPLTIEQFAGALDVFHAPNFSLPPVRAARSLVTIHDLTFLHYPQGAVPSLRHFLSQSVPSAARRAAHIIADSQATKDDLMEWLKLPADKISVVYAGVDERFRPVRDEAQLRAVRERYGLHRPFILGLGTLEPRKNFVGLMRAFAEMQQSHPLGHELIIAGTRGWLYEPIEAAARSAKSVRLLGYVDEADLPALYSLASVFCLPSYYEGFGIPCVEAMACGTPVVCSNRPCLPEIVGDAGLSVEPDDRQALADALLTVLNDTTPKQQLIQRGFARAKEFPWSRAARHLLDVYCAEGE